ncbi:MAG: type I DNA topoisomerase [Planctomycetota bacterium]
MTKYLVIVESPTKAKTLKKFLGKDYVVESSIGHIRDLPANASEVPAKYKQEKWSRLGVNVEKDFEPLYVISTGKRDKIKELKGLLKGVDVVLLATDEDREGEAISWHLLEVLQPKQEVRRMVFHEITKSAIMQALEDTRDIDTHMVQAQEARRIIDRLYGYEVSPVLWKKIKPKLSAGRVQSVATAILVERERARMRFVPSVYWDLVAEFETPAKETFEARLVELDKKRIASGKDFDPDTGQLKKRDVHLVDEAQAKELEAKLADGTFKIASAEEKPFTRTPAPPFTTSTLQQEGNRKLRFDSKRTMRAAQRLYENGFITYMRTDSVVLSSLAVDLTRDTIQETYGPEYLPSEPRHYKGKVKNAQEAHEAIRPAGDRIHPVSEIQAKLGGDEAKVYELIWKRTMASQMKNAVGRRMTLRVVDADGSVKAVFQATGSVIDFPGFLRAYVEGADDPEAALGDKETILPAVQQGDIVTSERLEGERHQTTPPARLTEASLVKALEESGIGRPSTYASIIDTIQRRDYTFKKGSALVPTFTAFAVVGLMEEHMGDLIDPNFTARMEDRLDAIARGEDEMLAYLRDIYLGNGHIGLQSLVAEKTEEIDARTVCSIPIGADGAGRSITVRVGRYGHYLERLDPTLDDDHEEKRQTAPIPDGTCPDEVTVPFAVELLETSAKSDEPMGKHPESGEPIFLKSGRFGPYVQLGQPEKESGEKPKMVSLLKGMTPETLTFEQAVALTGLPRVVGQDDAGEEIVAHNGRYGPYIKRGSDTRSLGPDDDLLTLSEERARFLLSQEKKRGRQASAEPLKVFEKLPGLDGDDVRLLKGRYGPYVTDGTVNASLPKDADPETFSAEDVVDLILRARERKGKQKTKKKSTTKAVAKRTTKKKATKKKATKKASKKSSTKRAASKQTPKKKSDDA